MIVLNRCFDLAVHRDRGTGVVVLEYASEGRVVETGAAYSNRYVSVLTITERQGHPMARLPQPDRRLRRCRLAGVAPVIGLVALAARSGESG